MYLLQYSCCLKQFWNASFGTDLNVSYKLPFCSDISFFTHNRVTRTALSYFFWIFSKTEFVRSDRKKFLLLRIFGRMYSKFCKVFAKALFFKTEHLSFLCHKTLWVALLECLYSRGAAPARTYVMVCLHLGSLFYYEFTLFSVSQHIPGSFCVLVSLHLVCCLMCSTPIFDSQARSLWLCLCISCGQNLYIC